MKTRNQGPDPGCQARGALQPEPHPCSLYPKPPLLAGVPRAELGQVEPRGVPFGLQDTVTCGQ